MIWVRRVRVFYLHSRMLELKLRGVGDNALVIGAEKMSTFLDWEDRSTCILFGDGAGAAVLKADGEGRGLMPAVTGSDGRLADLLWTPGGGSRNPMSHEMIDRKEQYIQMQGRDVFKHAVVRMGDAVLSVLEQNEIDASEISFSYRIRPISALLMRLRNVWVWKIVCFLI